MDIKSILGPHWATTIVSIAVAALLIKLIIGFFRGKNKNKSVSAESTTWTTYLDCFFSGVLFANAVPHFSHGISGETFPAPFGFLLGTGFLEHLSNVIWGFISIVLGYYLFVKGKVSGSSTSNKIIFFSGLLAMSIFLSYVFSH